MSDQEEKRLTPAQQHFVSEYLTSWNATTAYATAYPRASLETARRNGHKLLTKTDILAEVKRRLAEQCMTADEALTRLSEQAGAAYSAYILADGTIDLPQIVADGKAYLIKKIRPTQWGRVIEFYDAQAALIHIDRRWMKVKELEEIEERLAALEAQQKHG